MPTTSADPLAHLSANAGRSGVLLDFDGTLSEIVAHPDLAEAVPGARETLAELVSRYALVAVVSGRPAEEVGERLGVEGVRVVGRYGLEGALHDDVRGEVELAIDGIEGVWAEDKGASIAIHFRSAPDAAGRVEGVLEPIAAAHDLEVIGGKMVWELVPRDAPRKGGAVAQLLQGLDSALYAGDDQADLEAFQVLSTWDGMGICVAVRGPETPDELVRAADLVVEGPTGLVELLAQSA